MFQSGPQHIVHFNRLFTLSVFILSGLHCNYIMWSYPELSVSVNIVLQCFFAHFWHFFPRNTWNNFEFAVFCFEFAKIYKDKRKIQFSHFSNLLCFEFARDYCVCIFQQRPRWLGHVTRMDNNRIPKQILLGQLIEGTRRRGRLLLSRDPTFPLFSWFPLFAWARTWNLR